MWVDTNDCVPIADGMYWAQTVFGDVRAIYYTYEGGWNTHYDNGKLYNKFATRDGYIVRWHKVDHPEPVPKEWKESYFKTLIRKED